MKVVTVIGARPQFIKAAAVEKAIGVFNGASSRRRSGERILEILVHTGQHYDYLLDGIFFEELEIRKPDYSLGVGSGSHGKQTARMMERMEPILKKEKPDGVLVYGDTNSTLAGALVAAKMKIPVAHVEAGLRSYDRAMPEETNRLLADHLSTLLFCPTDQAVRNLSKEGIKTGKENRWVIKVGDVMYDSILLYSKLAEKRSTILEDLNLFHPQSAIPPPPYYLATLHRAENTDVPERLGSILRALDEIGKDILVILPLHPRTRKMMKSCRLFSAFRGVRLIEPVSYLDMLALEKNARAILTDSGGVQKEAYWLKVPCVTLRNETEWVETVESGWNRLAGTETRRIVREAKRIGMRRPYRKGLFGDGRAGEKIVQALVKGFGSYE